MAGLACLIRVSVVLVHRAVLFADFVVPVAVAVRTTVAVSVDTGYRTLKIALDFLVKLIDVVKPFGPFEAL